MGTSRTNDLMQIPWSGKMTAMTRQNLAVFLTALLALAAAAPAAAQKYDLCKHENTQMQNAILSI